MATLGPNDLKQFAVPTNWDAAMLTRLQLATGETYEQLISDIAAGLAMKNGTLLTNPLVASLISTTAEAAIEYPIGVSNGFERHTEYGKPNGERAKSTGSMLPLESWDRALFWSGDMLRKARRTQIDNDISSALADLENLWEKTVLERLFKSTYTSVGSSGKSMPIADGGTADSTYIPPQMPARASTFAYTHTHLGRLDGISQANLETQIKHLWEHGKDGPFELLIAQADVADWSNTTNVTGWVKRAAVGIRYGTQTDLAEVAPDYVAAIETSAYGPVNVRASARVPTKYWAVYKSYGALDPRNPLVVRESPDYSIGGVLLPGRQYPITSYPIEGAILFSEFGVGVADRVGAAVCFNHDDNAYVDPTIL
jgi:hypothetical protein